jgi:hypothetical protein
MDAGELIALRFGARDYVRTMTERPKEPRAAGESVSGPMRDLAALPPPVIAIRARILAACATRDVEALRIPIDWNEMRPMFERSRKHPAGTDPIDIVKSLSFDSKGREILGVLSAVLAQPFVKIARGPFVSYEWPAYARRPEPPADEAAAQALWSCVRFFDLTRSNAEGRPHVMRLGIGADGVWHYFWNDD